MKVAVIALDDPYGQADGGRLRMRAICEAIEVAGHELTLIFPGSEDAQCENDERYLGQRMPAALGRLKRRYFPLPTAIGARNPRIAQQVADSAAEMVVVSHLSLVQHTEALPKARRWLDLSDLWSDFAAREAANRRGLPRLTTRMQARHLARLERQAVAGASIVSAAGWKDAERLSTATGTKVHWLPTPISLEIRSQASHPTRRAAGFIGNFDFWPNRDAFDLLAKNWWPHLRSQGWSLLLAGNGSELLPLELGMTSLGFVESTREFYDSIDVALAPIRLGGGIKVKLVEALMHGIPAVATEAAIEGLDPLARQFVQVVGEDGTGIDISAAAALEPDSGSLSVYETPTFNAAVQALIDE